MLKLKKLLLLVAPLTCTIWLAGCFFGINDSYHHIADDMYLTCWDEHCKIVVSPDGNPSFSAEGLIEKSIVAMGNNSDFILVKQHPHLSDELEKRITGTRSANWHYELLDAKDSVFLLPNDSLYYENNKWYHLKGDWTDPDSLKPYKKITNYYIIDLRKGNGRYVLHSFNNATEFEEKKRLLGVPNDIVYDFYRQELE